MCIWGIDSTNTPLCIFQVLEGHDGVLRQTLLPRHCAQGVDSFSLCLAHAKEQHKHLRQQAGVRL